MELIRPENFPIQGKASGSLMTEMNVKTLPVTDGRGTGMTVLRVDRGSIRSLLKDDLLP
jgi:hypothetical protein